VAGAVWLVGGLEGGFYPGRNDVLPAPATVPSTARSVHRSIFAAAFSGCSRAPEIHTYLPFLPPRRPPPGSQYVPSAPIGSPAPFHRHSPSSHPPPSSLSSHIYRPVGERSRERGGRDGEAETRH